MDSSSQIEQPKRTEMNDVLDVLMKEFASVKVEEIINQANFTEENVGNLTEYKGRLAIHMVELAKYISEGAEVHPALNAPQEVKEEFPNSKEVKSLTQEVRTLLIENAVEKVLEEEDSD